MLEGAGKGFPGSKCEKYTFEWGARPLKYVIALSAQLIKKEGLAPIFMLEKSISIS